MKKQGILLMLFMAFIIGFTPSVNGQNEAALKTNIAKLRSQGLIGTRLQEMIISRANGLQTQNRPYVMDGKVDCWGYVQQVWNSILIDCKVNESEFGNTGSHKWVKRNGGLLVGDAGSADWVAITDWNVLAKGVPLSSHQGHAWGGQWHGVIFVQKGQQYESTPATNPSGAALRTRDAGMKYYYKPLNDLLKAADLPISTGMYKIALKNGKALDAHQPDVNANGGKIQIWDPSGAANQQWYLTAIGGGKFTIRIAASNKVLDLNASNTENYGGITLWTLNGATGSPNQQWLVTPIGNGFYKIVPSLSPTRALAIYGNDLNPNGIKVHLWDFLNGPEQSWQFTRL
jgi:hypothetical protein